MNERRDENEAASHKRFFAWLAVVAAVGLAVRLAYILLVRRDHPIGGDAFFYHAGANLLVDGKGFIAPFPYGFYGVKVQAADHPPLYLIFLSIPSLVGLRTVLEHLLWSAALGTGTIVAMGFLGRRVGGVRVGLIAATLAAVYPNIWMWDGTLLSETLAILLATLAILLAYRFLDQPSVGRAAALGAMCGTAALARSELILLLPALLLPAVLVAKDLARRDRMRLFGVAGLLVVAVVGPWIGYNLTRFENPVFLSSQFEPTLAGANCRDTYSGRALGSLTSTCVHVDIRTDQSVEGRRLRAKAWEFVQDNLDRVPIVVGARLGRVTNTFRISEQVDFDVGVEDREREVTLAGLASYYLIVIAAIGGAVMLRRRRSVLLFPLLAVPAVVLVSVAVTYGTTRFRATAETSLVVLAAIALDALWTRFRQREGTGPMNTATV